MSDKKGTSYKTCVVPECANTSVTALDKLFISLPKDQKARRAWQRAMRRVDFVSDKGSRYCCEDHFNVSFNNSKRSRQSFFAHNVYFRLKKT